MLFFEKMRRRIFWGVDALKGGRIRYNYTDIHRLLGDIDAVSFERSQKEYLNSILLHAVKNVDFYREYDGFGSLDDFPVVNKSIVRDNESLFLAAGYSKENLFKQETSGSTGMPFAVYQDSVKRVRATADTLYFSKLANYELGSRLYFSRVWEKASKRSKFTCSKQNWVTHDASSLSDDSIKDLINAWERDSSTKNVLIFASSLTAIAKYIVRNNFVPKAKIESFITLSEALDPWTKKTIEEKYNTSVFSRYSDQELGILAQQLPHSDDFLVNVASFYVEILDMEKDIPARPGEPGRIVVTDLFNHSMPLIRYDTGDVAVLKNPKSTGGRMIFESVGGRRVDYIFDTSGNALSPYVINTPMHEFLEIQQYQFIQDGEKDYRMLLNMKDNGDFTREGEMIKMLKSFLGSDASIKVEYVNEIPVLKSGKRKQVVNNYKSI